MAAEPETVHSGEDVPSSGRKRDLVSKALRYLADEKRVLAGLAVLSIVAAQVESLSLVLIAVIADGAARGDGTAQLEIGTLDLQLPIWTAASLTAAGIVVTAALVLANGYLAAKTFARLERASRDEIVSRHAAAGWEYQSTEKSSRLQGRLLRLMDARATAFGGLVMWSRALATIAVFVIVAAVISPMAAVVLVAFGVLLSLAMLPIRRAVVRLGARSADEEVGLAADVAEAVDHGPDVHVFRAWPAFLSRFDRKSHSLQGVRSRIGIAKNLTPVVYQYGALALILVVLIIAVLLSSEGQLGAVAASALLLLRSVQYGQQLQQSLQQIAESVPRIELLDRQLSVPPPRMIPGDATMNGINRLELQDVYYTYPGSEGPALRGVSLNLRPGLIVGLAGPSGSGKSTLAQILLRLRWPTSGYYLVNGRSAADFSAASWSGVVSHVPQQPRLLHGTLAENVAFFDESITPEIVRRTLDSVGLDDMVRDLPQGVDTEVGPTGRSLSGGQVQRLGIARALAREPKLVVLDEPTSALDVNAERVVGDALVALRGRPDMLVIIIAHRPSTLALCDEFVVLRDGAVAEVGTPTELAADGDFLKVMPDLAPLSGHDADA